MPPLTTTTDAEWMAASDEPLSAQQIRAIQSNAQVALQQALAKLPLRQRAVELAVQAKPSNHGELVYLAESILNFLMRDVTNVRVTIETMTNQGSGYITPPTSAPGASHTAGTAGADRPPPSEHERYRDGRTRGSAP